MTDEATQYHRYLELYQDGHLSWDDPLPPPEIIDLVSKMPAGRALDLGCGFGRCAVYLGERGWSVDGVDFIPQAVEIARQRAMAAGLSDRVRFHQASVTDLGFLAPAYDLAIDVGCMHSFTSEILPAYRDELVRLLLPGSQFVLFARLRETEPIDENGPKGIREDEIMNLLDDHFMLEKVERGISQMEDKPAWNSGWFWFRRR